MQFVVIRFDDFVGRFELEGGHGLRSPGLFHGFSKYNAIVGGGQVDILDSGEGVSDGSAGHNVNGLFFTQIVPHTADFYLGEKSSIYLEVVSL